MPESTVTETDSSMFDQVSPHFRPNSPKNDSVQESQTLDGDGISFSDHDRDSEVGLKVSGMRYTRPVPLAKNSFATLDQEN